MSTAILYQSALFAWIFWAGLTLGCVALVYLHHSIRAAWSTAFLRLFEAGSRTLIPMGILLVILLLLGGSSLYPWLQDAYKTHHVVQHRAGWVNMTGVLIRTVVYFVFWVVTTEWLRASARRQDKTGNTEEAQKRFNFAPPAGVIHVVVLTFAMTDWVMTLDPAWFSTIFPAWFMVSQVLTALAFCTILVTTQAINKKGPYSALATKPMLRDWGNMMLGFTMLWAYFSLSQFLIIYAGNLPEETGYYATRMNSDWNMMGTLNVFLSFFLPFLVLLYNNTKRNAWTLRTAAAWILFMRIVDMYWTIIPFFNRNGVHATPGTHLLPSVILFLVIGAVWLAMFRFFWSQATPLPEHDPRMEEYDPSRIGTVEAHGHA
jgi:hypothetical protein